jgi:uncharacterized membrane protein
MGETEANSVVNIGREMTLDRKGYMQELYQRLGPLPLTLEDINDTMRFYGDYFDAAGPEREQAVIAELGSPAYVAAQAALKMSSGKTPLTPGTAGKSVKRNVSVIWLVILGIIASPVALPMAIASAVFVFSMLVAALSVVFAFSVSGIACIVTGAGVALYSATLFYTEGFPTAIYFMGSGLLTVGIGGFLTRFGWWLCALLVRGAKAVGTRFFNKTKKGEVPQYAQ